MGGNGRHDSGSTRTFGKYGEILGAPARATLKVFRFDVGEQSKFGSSFDGVGGAVTGLMRPLSAKVGDQSDGLASSKSLGTSLRVDSGE